MKCPYCSYYDSKVVDSRPVEDGESIRRRRECNKCGKRFTTYEKVEEIPVRIIKKDGNRQAYDRNKLLRGIIRSCEKRPVTTEEIENLVSDVEKLIFNSVEKEITSREIGEIVMEKLKDLDQVSYVRFASVYREFKDINSFMDELSAMLEKNKKQ